MTSIRMTSGAVTLVAGLLVCSAASGQAVVSDSFTGAPGPIAGQTGGTGFGGAYSGAGSTAAPGLTFPGLATAGNRFVTAGNNSGAFRNLGAPLNTDAGTIWVGFLAAGAPAGAQPNYAGVSFFSGGQSTEELFLGKPWESPNYGFDVSGVTAQNSATAPVTAAPSLLVYRISFTPAGETIDFFANAVPGGPAPTTPTLTFAIPEGSFADTFTSIRLQSGEGAGGAAGFSFDELRGGLSFADVAPLVPEPAGLALVAAAGLLLARRRRA